MSLRLVRVMGLVTVQDAGRRGRMDEGLAPGGALVPALLSAANRRAGNADGAPAVEILGRIVVRAESTVLVATDRGDALPLDAGAELAVESAPRRVAYLALRGEVEAPLVLGGRGTQRSAGIGALLATGAAIACAGRPAVAAGPPAPLSERAQIRIVPGPDLDAFEPGVIARLCSGPYRVLPASDRVGVRLEGPRLPHAPGLRAVSRPMVLGAIEVPADGSPIVLGPEHPTTGGYPVVAVVASADLGCFFARAAGAAVSFVSSRARSP